MRWKEYYLEAVNSVLVCFFTMIGMYKLLHPNAMRHDMFNQPFPLWLAKVLMWVIFIYECGLIVLLVRKCTRLLGWYCALLLFFVYGVYTLLIINHFFSYVPCSCGGLLRFLSWTQNLWLNVCFFVIIGTAIIISKWPWKGAK